MNNILLALISELLQLTFCKITNIIYRLDSILFFDELENLYENIHSGIILELFTNEDIFILQKELNNSFLLIHTMENDMKNENINEPEGEPPVENWDDLDLKPDILRGIYSYGYEKPSDIQKKSIPNIIKKHDTIAQAQSGMGKTASFSISTLQLIDVESATTQAVLISPTHELAKQTCNVVTHLGSMMQGLRIKTLIGGTSINDDYRDIQENPPHIIVGCAGRIHDMFRRRYLSGEFIKIMVLDEADEMLSQGFKTQIYNIFQYFNENIQVAIFSATFTDEVLDITQKFMRNPVRIIMKNEELSLECIQQYYIAVSSDPMKYDVLKDLFSTISISQSIIYCNSVKRVADLHEAMTRDGFSVCGIHGSMDKMDREREFALFRNGTYRVMISSNITARGIDIQHVSTVINFDIPKCVHTYLHRIGRSGRWGRKGMAINFVTRRDIHLMRDIENHYKIKIEELPSCYGELIS
jgi:translation initiation factor 4A